MKTAEEILKKHTGHAHGLMSASTIEAMKEYAKEVAREALKNASENAKYTTEDIEFCYRVTIDKQSILNEKNIPEL